MKTFKCCTLDQLLTTQEEVDTFDMLFGELCWGDMYNATRAELVKILNQADPDDFTGEEFACGYRLIKLMEDNDIDLIIDIEGSL